MAWAPVGRRGLLGTHCLRNVIKDLQRSKNNGEHLWGASVPVSHL